MGKKIYRIIAFMILIAIIPAIVIYTELKLPSIYKDSYYAELPEYYEKLNTTDSKKLVIIGGSNIAFGIDTTLLEQLLSQKGFDYSVCPFGLYAAVGTSAMLDLAIDTVKAGDVIVLSFEPYSDAMSCYFGATAFLKCAEDSPELILKLDSSRRTSVIGNYPSFLQERYSIVLSGDFPKVEGAYAKSSFDENCNMTYQRPGNIMSLGYDVSKPIDLSNLEITQDFIDQVNRFCTEATKKGANVYYSFSPMNSSSVSDTGSNVMEHYFDLCANSFPCRIISNPYNYLLPSAWFYDSNVHLNTSGSQLRTIQLAEDLLSEFGCYEALDIEMPQIPERSSAETFQNNTGTEYFEFILAENEEYYIISGLSELGLCASSLSIPVSYNGISVCDIEPDALDSASSLEELYIPQSIAAIPDRLFINCSSLSRLILEHTGSPCKISNHSLDGIENAKIFVPSEAYSYYRDGYGCESNLWSSYIDRIFTY